MEMAHHKSTIASLKDRQASIADAINGVVAEIEQLRQEITKKKSTIHGIEEAHVPADAALQRFESYLDAKIEGCGFEYAVRGFWSPHGARETPPYIFQAKQWTETVDVDSALCYLFRDQILAKFQVVMADQIKPGLPPKERRDMVAKLKRELLELEKAEEATICEAADLGVSIDRRPDVRPEVVLEWVD